MKHYLHIPHKAQNPSNTNRHNAWGTINNSSGNPKKHVFYDFYGNKQVTNPVTQPRQNHPAHNPH
nr:MAG TPA: hypothetical protein [Siphoviridae sp. ctcOR4]